MAHLVLKALIVEQAYLLVFFATILKPLLICCCLFILSQFALVTSSALSRLVGSLILQRSRMIFVKGVFIFKGSIDFWSHSGHITWWSPFSRFAFFVILGCSRICFFISTICLVQIYFRLRVHTPSSKDHGTWTLLCHRLHLVWNWSFNLGIASHRFVMGGPFCTVV